MGPPLTTNSQVRGRGEAAAAAPVRDLLLLSDLHLGSHLKPRIRGEYVHLAARIDEVLPRFLDHYAAQGPWVLVINGDFIDFWNIEFGRESAREGEELALRRARAAFDAYPGVEDALVRFLAAGNAVVFVTGNHDAELLYPGVRRAIKARLERASAADEGPASAADACRLGEAAAGTVSFVSWFLHEPGALWIEHGHLFDAACATTDVLAPTRKGRLVKTLAEVATRSFTNLMPEIDYDAPDTYTAADYARWAAARGLRFVLLVVLLYLRMVGQMLWLWVGRGRVDRQGRAAHQERLEAIAENAGLQMSTLSALQEMAPPPSTATVGGVLSVTALDVLLTLLSLTAAGLVIAALSGGSRALGAVIGLGLGVLAVRGIRRRRRKRAIADEMSEVAIDVGRMTEVPLVLMGHSHRGSIDVHGGVVYGNSGSWLDGSHLVVRRDRRSGRPTAVELRRWRNGGVMVLDRHEVAAADGRARTVDDRRAAAIG
ncbi:MAG: metallophosphoesterase [Myxococcales bacterium]|nr:metallophosphoesterase [Myxococcales bacterium]